MKLKLVLLFCISFVYLVMTLGSSNAASVCSSMNLPLCVALFDGVKPPHAVDISGKVIPESSTSQPDKPIILAKDSDDPTRGELKLEAAFDHRKHSTEVSYSLDGKTITTCVECHHTDQPSAPKGQEYLTRFDRKEVLTAAQLESSKLPVSSCRACHFKASTEPTDEFPPESVKYPKKSGKRPSGTLTNDVAYHINCNSCHDAVKVRNPQARAPQGCYDCHTKKK